MDYTEKYLKYKRKYYELKNMIGGGKDKQVEVVSPNMNLYANISQILDIIGISDERKLILQQYLTTNDELTEHAYFETAVLRGTLLKYLGGSETYNDIRFTSEDMIHFKKHRQFGKGSFKEFELSPTDIEKFSNFIKMERDAKRKMKKVSIVQIIRQTSGLKVLMVKNASTQEWMLPGGNIGNNEEEYVALMRLFRETVGDNLPDLRRWVWAFIDMKRFDTRFYINHTYSHIEYDKLSIKNNQTDGSYLVPIEKILSKEIFKEKIADKKVLKRLIKSIDMYVKEKGLK